MVKPNDMPANSRVWIYQSATELTEKQVQDISEQLIEFTSSWKAHQQPLKATFDIRYFRFIILMVDEQDAAASGCSIDKSVQLIKELEAKFNLSLLDRSQFAFKDHDEVKLLPKDQFEQMVNLGFITGDTIVFNNLVQTKVDLDQQWEIHFSSSWHADLFATQKTP
jgi:hypothetical protein